MKRIWNLALGTAVLCTVLLCGCAVRPHCPDSAAPTDPLTGQELQYPGERTAAVVIDNAPLPAPPSGALAALRWCWRP